MPLSEFICFNGSVSCINFIILCILYLLIFELIERYNKVLNFCVMMQVCQADMKNFWIILRYSSAVQKTKSDKSVFLLIFKMQRTISAYNSNCLLITLRKRNCVARLLCVSRIGVHFHLIGIHSWDHFQLPLRPQI